MSRTIDVKLAGRAFTVPQATIGGEVAWRRTVQPLIEPLGEMVIAAGVGSPTPERMVKLAFTSALFIDPAAVLDALCSYSPALAEQRGWIEENAYADEVLEALLTLFFGGMSSPRAATLPRSGAAVATT
jgi:hypothetical protein